MIKLNEDYRNDVKYLTFTDAVKLLGAGTGERIRNFVRDGKIQAYQLPNVVGLRVRNDDVLNLISVSSAKDDQ